MTTFRQFIIATAMLSSLLVGQAQATCNECGVVKGVDTVKQEGEASALGMVAGGVVGGLVGNQIGKGNGNTIATIAGAAGGAYAGREIEKKAKAKEVFKVHVQMDNGNTRDFMFNERPAFAAGDKVKVEEDQLVRAPATSTKGKKSK